VAAAALVVQLSGWSRWGSRATTCSFSVGPLFDDRVTDPRVVLTNDGPGTAHGLRVSVIWRLQGVEVHRGALPATRRLAPGGHLVLPTPLDVWARSERVDFFDLYDVADAVQVTVEYTSRPDSRRSRRADPTAGLGAMAEQLARPAGGR